MRVFEVVSLYHGDDGKECWYLDIAICCPGIKTINDNGQAVRLLKVLVGEVLLVLWNLMFLDWLRLHIVVSFMHVIVASLTMWELLRFLTASSNEYDAVVERV